MDVHSVQGYVGKEVKNIILKEPAYVTQKGGMYDFFFQN